MVTFTIIVICSFSYWNVTYIQVSSSQINGGVLLDSASLDDDDQRELFCMYLSPGNIQSKKVGKVSKLCVYIFHI